jgi:uncharacterized Rmd1/YagE family protein
MEVDRVERVEASRVSGDGEEIVLSAKDEYDNILAKLAVSNGLADSVKIATLENFMDEHIERVRHIPPILERGKRLPFRYSPVDCDPVAEEWC